MKRKALLGLISASMLTIIGGGITQAAFDENLNMYTLDTVVVEADKTKNKFGDTITEQSYYRTGGDVKVITREEIDKRHYTDMTEAIKRIPGVTFVNPGYRGGEYGYSFFSNSMAINGDSRVVVLVDGRRVDNSTSEQFGGSNASGTKAMVDLNQLTNIENVEKIEVIKGPGASSYGADATGGVINIITRKGGAKDTGTIDLSTGSWNKHVYNLTYSGSAGSDKSWKYFIAANRQMSGDSKYHDDATGKNYTYHGTKYKEDGVSFRLDKEFDANHNLRIWYNHKNGKDGYPIMAPDYRYWTESDWIDIIKRYNDGVSAKNNPGYRNLFILDALSGSYNEYNNNDLDITYTFKKDNGMESFVRVYNQSHHYRGRDFYPAWSDPSYETGYVPFPGSKEFDDFIKNFDFSSRTKDYQSNYAEKSRGVTFQYGKSVGKNDLLGSINYDVSKLDGYNWNWKKDKKAETHTKKTSIRAFLQDKIHITDKWDLTPSIRYLQYKTAAGSYSDYNGAKYSGAETSITPSINTEYAFSDSMSAYAGWSQIYRPVKSYDLTKKTPNGEPLKDEKGNVYTIGVKKDFGDRTTLAVHYDWTKMSNAVTNYSVWDKVEEKWKSKAVNAKETKKSFNVTFDHQVDSHWSVGLAYTHMYDEWKAQEGMNSDPEIDKDKFNVNTLINVLRPQNHYTANITYENGPWYTGLLVNWYTGCNRTAFSDSKFLVLDWNLNYEVNEHLSTYLTLSNLTNEAYQNSYVATYGVGAAPQPGRAVMVGAKYKF